MERTRWIPLSEALKELGVSRSTFDDWRRQGTAPRTMKLPSGKLRVSRSDLDRFIEACVEAVA
jgi:predicted DNA-binding transcriptional regulator AlpA